MFFFDNGLIKLRQESTKNPLKSYKISGFYVKKLGLLVRLWSTAKRLRAQGYASILLFPLNSYLS
jgi:hypothetical protein